MKSPLPLAIAACLPLASGFLASCADPSTPSPHAAAANPLVGTWTVDVQQSLERSDTLAKSLGIPPDVQALNRSMLRREQGSIRTFTATEFADVHQSFNSRADLDKGAKRRNARHGTFSLFTLL